MTPYELLSDDRTSRINDNCYVHDSGVNTPEMYYVGDEEFDRALFELQVDLVLLQRKRQK